MRRAWIGWGVLVAVLASLDVAAARETWRLAFQIIPGLGMGPVHDYRTIESYADGRAFEVRADGRIGTILSRTQIRDWTWSGQLEVWWPVMAAATLSIAASWFAKRRAWRLLAEFLRPSRPTIGRGMILIAIVGGESGATIAWVRAVGGDPATANWPAILICVAGSNLLALLPIGILLSFRDRDPGKPALPSRGPGGA